MNLPAVRTVQSPEITNALQQYSNRAQRHWERIITILRRDALEKEITFSVDSTGGSLLSRNCDNEFFRKINPKHPEYVIEDLKYISEHPLVTKNSKGLYLSTSLISWFNEIEPGVYNLELGRPVVKHYLSETLTVEYDASLIYTFKTKAAPILYKKGCLVVTQMYGFFELSEEEIRLIFGVDLVSDIKNLQKARIKEIEDLPIIRTGIYDRFDHLLIRLINPAMKEIKDAYKMGKCPFVLRSEPFVLKVKTGKRGAPKKKTYIRFHIEHPIEFAEAEEVLDDTEPKPTSNSPHPAVRKTDAIQAEIPFPPSDNEEAKLLLIQDALLEILTQSNANHVLEYQECVIAQIRERVNHPSQKMLPDAVLGWINYTKSKIEDPVGIARKLQKDLAKHLFLVYESKKAKGTKEHLKWDGKAPVKFPPSLMAEGKGDDKNDKEVMADPSQENAPADHTDWYEVWAKFQQAAINCGVETLKYPCELMYFKDFNEKTNTITIQVPSYVVRDYVLTIMNRGFFTILKRYFGDEVHCNFVEKWNASSKKALDEFVVFFDREKRIHSTPVVKWNDCCQELRKVDKVFQNVSLDSYDVRKNEIILRVEDNNVYDYIENNLIDKLREALKRYFGEFISLRYLISNVISEPTIIE